MAKQKKLPGLRGTEDPGYSPEARELVQLFPQIEARVNSERLTRNQLWVDVPIDDEVDAPAKRAYFSFRKNVDGFDVIIRYYLEKAPGPLAKEFGTPTQGNGGHHIADTTYRFRKKDDEEGSGVVEKYTSLYYVKSDVQTVWLSKLNVEIIEGLITGISYEVSTDMDPRRFSIEMEKIAEALRKPGRSVEDYPIDRVDKLILWMRRVAGRNGIFLDKLGVGAKRAFEQVSHPVKKLLSDIRIKYIKTLAGSRGSLKELEGHSGPEQKRLPPHTRDDQNQ